MFGEGLIPFVHSFPTYVLVLRDLAFLSIFFSTIATKLCRLKEMPQLSHMELDDTFECQFPFYIKN